LRASSCFMPYRIMPDSARQEKSATTYGLINNGADKADALLGDGTNEPLVISIVTARAALIPWVSVAAETIRPFQTASRRSAPLTERLRFLIKNSNRSKTWGSTKHS
jgi:hypothetical protein